MTFLLDTCVVSELVSRKPAAPVVHWIDSVQQDSVYLSAITIGEIKRGIVQSRDPSRKAKLESWLHSELLVRFHERILSLDVGVMLSWGELVGDLARKGVTMPAVDSLIAATAVHHECTLVTRNTQDFRHATVKILNPWIK